MEAAKAQNWVVEPQKKKKRLFVKILKWCTSLVTGHGNICDFVRVIS
jgi:hypothetical protein